MLPDHETLFACFPEGASEPRVILYPDRILWEFRDGNGELKTWGAALSLFDGRQPLIDSIKYYMSRDGAK